jgi:hypothetical protein
MNFRYLVSCLVILGVSHSCVGGRVDHAPVEDGSEQPQVPAADLVAWTEADPLPVLDRQLLGPVSKDPEHWTVDSTGVDFKRHSTPQVPTEAPFATDADAIAAAKAWIESNFGKPRQLLEAVSVDHSASGSPEPQYDWDRGHTIVLS